jgi:elongation factor 1-alpha
MITGTFQADVAIRMIASPAGYFHSGLSMEGQTREQAVATFTIEVKQMISCHNETDAKGNYYEEERYNKIEAGASFHLKQEGPKI